MSNKTNFVSTKPKKVNKKHDKNARQAKKPSAFVLNSCLSQPWKQAETGLCCRRFNPPHCHDLEKLAQAILSSKERDFCYQLSSQGTRLSDWLLGRAVAKDAIRQFAGANYGVELKYLDIEILANELGKPEVFCPYLEAQPQVSICHTQGYVIAVAAPPNQPIGIDLERWSYVNLDDCQRVAFSDVELQLLPPQASELHKLGLWCAKEAAAKAMGTGIRDSLMQWRISRISNDGSQIQVTHQDKILEVKLWYETTEVLAICTPEIET